MQPFSPTPNPDAYSVPSPEPGDAVRRGQKLKWEKIRRQLERESERDVRKESARTAANAAIHVEELRRRYAQLERQIEGLQSQLEQRNDKVRRMQESLSWRITAPLRALRRAATEQPQSAAAQAVSASTAPVPQFLWSMDDPCVWQSAPAVGTIRGWFVWLPEGKPATSLRITIDDETFPAVLNFAREDVVSAHSFDATRSLHCGFQLNYRLEADSDQEVVFEVRCDDGRWIPFEKRQLHTSSSPQTVRDYSAWVEAFGKVTPEKAAALRARLAAAGLDAKGPLISVLMPVYNTPEKWLCRVIDSVREQVYPNWELCIADDASPAPHVRQILERYAALDSRVKVTFRGCNGHISHASNSALELVTGEFFALLDHDDEIPPDALAEVALHLATHPDTDLVYSDEDKIDEEGNRSTPYFKPDYLPDLLTSQNCCSHLSVYRSAIVREVGGFRPGFEGSQDWDLALRVVEKSSPARIRHIPKVLYHWRMIAGSTARHVSEKNYAVDAGRRALQEHFARRGIQVDVRPVAGAHWQIVHPLPERKPLVSIIIPTHNGASLLRMCLASLFSLTDYAPFEVLVINNRSDEPESQAFLDELRSEPGVRVLDYDQPFNYSAINNFAARHAAGELLLLLNNDIEIISATWLSEMVSHALRPEIGAVGAMLYYPDMTVQHAGIVLGLGGVANHAFVHQPFGTAGQMNRARLTQNYSAVTAACLCIRKAIYEQVGGFNETELAVAFNDVDFCLRVRSAGYRNLWTPFAELVHHESATRGADDSPEKKARFQKEVDAMRRLWGTQLDHDPAYNLNLALSFEGWDLAWPPRS